MNVDRRRGMIEAVHPDLSITAQCRLLSISRSSFYYAPQPESEETLTLMRVIDAAFLDMPWYGSRQMVRHLRRQGVNIGRRRVRRLMTKMGLSPIYQRPRTSDPHPQHRIYPYLLRNLSIVRPNQVWSTDITYIRLAQGFVYLVAPQVENGPSGVIISPKGQETIADYKVGGEQLFFPNASH